MFMSYDCWLCNKKTLLVYNIEVVDIFHDISKFIDIHNITGLSLVFVGSPTDNRLVERWTPIGVHRVGEMSDFFWGIDPLEKNTGFNTNNTWWFLQPTQGFNQKSKVKDLILTKVVRRFQRTTALPIWMGLNLPTHGCQQADRSAHPWMLCSWGTPLGNSSGHLKLLLSQTQRSI